MPGSTCVSSAGRSLSLQFPLLLLLLLLPPPVLLTDPGVLSPGRQPFSNAHVDPESCAVDLLGPSLSSPFQEAPLPLSARGTGSEGLS